MSNKSNQIVERNSIIGQREAAHAVGKCCSPLNGTQGIYALLGDQDIATLEGQLLTLVDATLSDPRQCKAFKDVLRQILWRQWVDMLDKCNDPAFTDVTVKAYGFLDGRSEAA